MANYDLSNFVIDRVIRGIMKSSADDSVLWSINQITNPSLSCSTDTTDAVDMLGTPIVTFERAKTVEFSAENALFDLGLFAAQGGAEKEIATSDKKIVVPTFEEVEVTDPEATVTLKHVPVGKLTEIHILKGDSTLGTRYTNGTQASASEFVQSEGSAEITLPTGLTKGDTLIVFYDYESEAAVSVTHTAKDFPKAGKFIMEVLGCDVCDQTTLVHAYIIISNAKLTSDFDITFSTDSTHPLTIRCNQNYCDKQKKLVQIVIPKED